ncbi:MAG: 16S rRNA (guanine(966)-N(2))-methyltransferase RsmD [candidate division WOR-3 bacterium]
MRVSVGKYQRRELVYPRSGLRPTKAITRLAMFNAAGSRTRGARVLDLYAGGGSLGIEALSRGAESCTFVEQSGPVVSFLRANVRGMPGAEVLRGDVRKVLKRLKGREFDLIIADPPYLNNLVQPTVDLIAEQKLLVADGWLMVEHHRLEVPFLPENWELVRRTSHGDSCISILRRQS